MRTRLKQHKNKHPSDKGNEELGALRDQIDGIDEKIVSLLSERQQIVEQVVAFKKANNLPIYHPAREEDLISGRRRQGEEAGLDPDFVEDLYRSIIRRSRVEQASRMSLKSVHPGAVVLIVGGKGEMGRYFMKWFGDAGYEVRSIGRTEWDDAEHLCKGTDLVILSVPIDNTGEIAHQIAPCLPKKAVLADLTSLKEKPLKAMMDAHPGPVLGLHPLFGPSTSTLDKQIIVATPGRDDSACQWILDQFVSWGSIIVTADAREHDEIMHIVQGLRHFATFTFGSFLRRRQANLPRSLEFSSPIYRLEIGMVGRLFAQDPGLYYEIIMASPRRLALLREYMASMCEDMELLEKGDKSLFRDEFAKIAEWFGPFSDQAMRESTYLINKLIERF